MECIGYHLSLSSQDHLYLPFNDEAYRRLQNPISSYKASSVPFPHCIGSVFIPIILTLTLAGLQRSYPRNSVGLIARLAVASRPDKNLVVAMTMMMTLMMVMMVMVTRIMTSKGLFRATCFISMNSNPSNEVKNYHFWQNQVPARAVGLQCKLHTDI